MVNFVSFFLRITTTGRFDLIKNVFTLIYESTGDAISCYNVLFFSNK